MSCPTCDHTMQAVGDAVWWCPCCGTIKYMFVHDARNVEVPRAITDGREILEPLSRYPKETVYPDGPCLKDEDLDELKNLMECFFRPEERTVFKLGKRA